MNIYLMVKVDYKNFLICLGLSIIAAAAAESLNWLYSKRRLLKEDRDNCHSPGVELNWLSSDEY